MLSNFQLENRSLLQSLLIGQPELRDVIRASSMEQLRQRVLASCHLGPLEAGETRAYIEHRLAHAGWKGDPAITAEAYAQIHQETGGIPRRINALCKRLLLGAFLSEQHRIGAEQVAEGVAELRGEIGPGSGPADRARGAMRDSSGPALQGRAAAEGGAGPVPEEMRPFMVSAITARLDRLERSVEAMLDKVQQLAAPEPVRPAAKAGTASVQRRPVRGPSLRR